MKNTGISIGGEGRLRKAIEAEVQREYAQELSSAKSFSQRQAVKEKFRNEAKERMRRLASPYALYSSRRLGNFSAISAV
jgi:hypothetical protein